MVLGAWVAEGAFGAGRNHGGRVSFDTANDIPICDQYGREEGGIGSDSGIVMRCSASDAIYGSSGVWAVC